ncbi:MAG TPA: GntR family transcriptional regulator [Chryseolinea sp.]
MTASVKEYPLFDDFEIDDRLVTPKYIQVSNAILRAVEEDRIKTHDQLPSINELSFCLNVSRDTAEKSYKHLKQIGLLTSVPGKGFYVRGAEESKCKVFLLFNELSESKKIIYDALLKDLGDGMVDFYVYYDDFDLFRKILAKRRFDYTHYVISPHAGENPDDMLKALSSIPSEKLIILDPFLHEVNASAGVYQNFEKDIYNLLQKAKDRIFKYKCIKVICPDHACYATGIIKGIKKFAEACNFQFCAVPSARCAEIQTGDLFVSIYENDFIHLAERIMVSGLIPGHQVGIISYNDLPCKKLILGGITTVSADFQFMGRQLARLINQNAHENIVVPVEIQWRASL